MKTFAKSSSLLAAALLATVLVVPSAQAAPRHAGSGFWASAWTWVLSWAEKAGWNMDPDGRVAVEAADAAAGSAGDWLSFH
jgi:hypothetical protein